MFCNATMAAAAMGGGGFFMAGFKHVLAISGC